MNSFKEIHTSFLATDAFLSERESAGRTAHRRAHWAKLKTYNGHAYFVMLFAQLEQHIDNLCDTLINKKRASAKWKLRRPWDSVDLERIPFMRKVALLTDKGRATYALVDEYYRIRCHIAHGNSATVAPIALPVVITDLKDIAKELNSR